MDYQFLVGERFSSQGETFEVDRVLTIDDRVIVQAHVPGTQGLSDCSFPAEVVMQSLVTEEIELFQTGGLITSS